MVRPHFEYGSVYFITGAQSHRNSLEKVQNQGLRIITGDMRSTHISKMQDISGIPPLLLRREGKALRQFTKARTLEDQPLRNRIQTPCSGRLKRSSFVREANKLQGNFKEDLPWEM